MPDKGPPPAGGWLARLKEPKVWLQAGLVLLAIKKTLFSSKRGDADKTTAANVVEDVEPEPPGDVVRGPGSSQVGRATTAAAAAASYLIA
jgi:hypothetical protein